MWTEGNTACKTENMYEEVLNQLPYKSSFRFVDTIISLDENGVVGEYTLRPDAFFYEDHFPGNPVTPGVILTEIMAQIGLVVLGIYLLMQAGLSPEKKIIPLFTSSQVDFHKLVLPGEKLKVVSKKQYFRFNKLKCTVEMMNEKNETVARGIFSGMMIQSNNNPL
ncbi:3-hydroxyacyl-[acyl-carrier-protein] dehydratase [Parafilimonas terrae]|uniref:3-hydroxyacyl-[acyl-carrier-protein] dehydratase n=2 Tax=Parafilimonas terrae TaxID=1465490 RepID=A0A1I5XY17_9BACT|nr:3-hydroxyacyl-[acyl-carrier-protein] dehydratase [Parafilimonas terrae]